MNENHLKRLFPHASPAFIKSNTDTHQGLSHSELQKQQNDDLQETGEVVKTPNVNHRPKEEEDNGPDDNEFQITILVNVSDKRRRDLDGSATTILDALCTSRRQLLDSSGPTHKTSKSK